MKQLQANDTTTDYWEGFNGGDWQDSIDVRDFIQQNLVQYDGDESFLAGPTEATTTLNNKVMALKKQEREAGGVLDADNDVPATLTSHGPGYIEKDLEKIVGLQTDKPLKRAFMPYGGIRMAEDALEAYGFKTDPKMHQIFTEWRKTHNQGVFDVYTPDMRKARHYKIITGLPDAYGRGRIIPDLPRVALYGIDRLIEDKIADHGNVGDGEMTNDVIQLREQIADQVKALKGMKKMAASYGFDISKPAKTAQEAVQWVYFGYLAAVKTQNGAAMSVGRIDSFLDIFIQRDLDRGLLDEKHAQELIDQFVMKLRMVRFIRTTDYNDLFSGDPIWATLSMAGVGMDGRHHVNKTSFRVLKTLENMGAAPEPNITLLWDKRLPDGFKRYATKVSIDSSTIQYENDALMRNEWGTDYYGIACCVSAQPIADGVQFFGARANMAKTVLYAINGGVDEMGRAQVGPAAEPITTEYIDYDDFMEKFDRQLDWVADVYVNALNAIHYMHDKYDYEAEQLCLKNSRLDYTFATGISGLSHATDSLSAIKYGHVKVIRDEDGIAVDFKADHDYPRYGNNDDRADNIAKMLVKKLFDKMNKHHLYHGAKLSTSVLTITSNVVYGKNTGTTPNGRQAGEPFSPGANPAYGAEQNGALASLLSTAKIPYKYARDGISNTFGVTPRTLGNDISSQEDTLVNMVDGYMENKGMHLNINVFNRDTLKDAQAHPEKYPTLTVRVSGYCVYFADLTKEQQDDVISRTYFEAM
ncbi:formate C-acetyltransferase [Loigolactobacillus coryniformis]|jgi:formate C-acetyltransferase|uniref:Formate acetyltransferase n=2 Tax=Loigolactobacillus coryniformis subsp. coryniformis TaxID=115541 RepID=A0A0R1F9G9_9LACO|nr:formate C-acetyltransferase [Loigolactobacillus coryniformis]MDT3392606.1 formate C-acetyltransferase [Bacillota bacterium]OEH89903.1 formate acetyltransferase [Loigolactobacillus coryniformis subsp. coryniformis]ATO55511.1 formate C-acetyltransferase [Loigolactobacillus coryniformis subsp. coryniformis KCTC 3167 = DSM 20001]KRK18333.1 formate C-acetyltransferase (pyruvate formate-lyase) (formate acetyltransferase) [Loigolactobacillus coryniformis subsp. coryniformis KCTC 3167 = DSM 20001]M